MTEREKMLRAAVIATVVGIALAAVVAALVVGIMLTPWVAYILCGLIVGGFAWFALWRIVLMVLEEK